MATERRQCPGCGSVAVARVMGPSWSCSRCGHVAKVFPRTCDVIDRGPDALGPVRENTGASGYRRRPVHLDD